MQTFAQDPQKFIHTWIASQSRDLEVILGDDARGVRDEDLRRSDFFRLPWVRIVSLLVAKKRGPNAVTCRSRKQCKCTRAFGLRERGHDEPVPRLVCVSVYSASAGGVSMGASSV